MMDIDVNIVAERIRKRRDSLGVDRNKLADMIGSNYSTIYRYENAKIDKPKLSSLMKIADVLNCNIDYLLGYTDDPTPAALNLERVTDIELLIQYVKNVFQRDDLTLNGDEINQDDIDTIKNAIDIGLMILQKNKHK